MVDPGAFAHNRTTQQSTKRGETFQVRPKQSAAAQPRAQRVFMGSSERGNVKLNKIIAKNSLTPITFVQFRVKLEKRNEWFQKRCSPNYSLKVNRKANDRALEQVRCLVHL